jgi:2-hydroxychromene-2-carboxylate isomerase
VNVTFYYDFSSPYAYLGATQIERIAQERGAQVSWRPILLGALFRRIGTPDVPLTSFSAPKRTYMARDIQHWAGHWQVPFAWPSRFPMRTVVPLRLALAAAKDAGDAVAIQLARALFAAYWIDDRDIADVSVVRAIGAAVGLSPATIDSALEADPKIKQALIDSTEEAIVTGVVGVPTFVVGAHQFWGQDRLDLVARVLEGWSPPAG